jgi:hypothetical protein
MKKRLKNKAVTKRNRLMCRYCSKRAVTMFCGAWLCQGHFVELGAEYGEVMAKGA